MPELPQFDGCDAQHVFAEVEECIELSETRALWSRLRDEISRRGIGSAITYLEGEFTHITGNVERELGRHK